MQKLPFPILGTAILGTALLGISVAARPTPILVWNASASVPVGLYHVVSGTSKRGDFVLVRTPESVTELTAQRGYLPLGVPLVKRLAAVVGDRVCTARSTIQINGATVARQLKTDRVGRTLPNWSGCRKLERDEYFLLADAPGSFDSRYFGPVKGDRLIGRLVPLWTE